MNRAEFIALLKSELEKSQIKNINDILADYEEHFHHGLNKGKSESEIALALGSPLTIAKAYKTENMIQEVRQSSGNFKWGLAFSVLGRLLILAPFNFIVFFIPGVIIFSLLAAGWSAAVAVASAGLAVFSLFPGIFALATSFWISISAVFASLGLLCLGAFSLMIMFVISKHIILGLINYLQWNLKFILQNAEK